MPDPIWTVEVAPGTGGWTNLKLVVTDRSIRSGRKHWRFGLGWNSEKGRFAFGSEIGRLGDRFPTVLEEVVDWWGCRQVGQLETPS